MAKDAIPRWNNRYRQLKESWDLTSVWQSQDFSKPSLRNSWPRGRDLHKMAVTQRRKWRRFFMNQHHPSCDIWGWLLMIMLGAVVNMEQSSVCWWLYLSILTSNKSLIFCDHEEQSQFADIRVCFVTVKARKQQTRPWKLYSATFKCVWLKITWQRSAADLFLETVLNKLM